VADERQRIAVIGGGWAGCAAAVELARNGCQVTLFEAARTLGGRARQVELDEQMLDNGQHILLGAYSETLRMLRQVGIDPNAALLRLPLQMRYPPATDGIEFIAPRLPAPLHLVLALWRARGLEKTDKLALARFFSAARWMGWQLNADCSVNELLLRFDQTPRLIQLLWRPLCIAALNTPPERASARIFLRVLGDSLGARRAASDMLLPRLDLTSLFPQRAAAFIENRGGIVLRGVRVRKIEQDTDGWQVDGIPFGAVVVATQASHAATLLAGLCDTTILNALTHEAITTCYLRYEAGVRLRQPFFALTDEPASGKWGQYVFDRGQLDEAQRGLLAVVVSVSDAAIAIGQQALSAAIAAQLADELQQPELAAPEWTKVVSERRATFACTPSQARPENATDINTLVIAGDYTSSDYPGTLEAAVRSGINAARLLLNLPSPRKYRVHESCV